MKFVWILALIVAMVPLGMAQSNSYNFGTVTTVPAQGTATWYNNTYQVLETPQNPTSSGPFSCVWPTYNSGTYPYLSVTVTFDPSLPGPYSGSCSITYYDPEGGYVTATLTLSGTLAGYTGYINPKYVVVGVVYAPPGSKSYVDYTNSTTVSSTNTLTSTFTSSYTWSVSVTQPGGLFGFLGGSETSTQSETLTQENQDSKSVTASYTDTSSLQLYGPGSSNPCDSVASDYVGVDHDCDLIKVWVNPVMTFAVTSQGVVWTGYGYSELDTVAPIHIVDVKVGCLNGALSPTDSRCSPALGEFQRTWAANENWPSGQGPGLTAKDLSNILAADQWGQCTPTSAIGASVCPTYTTPGFVLLPPEFKLSDQENVPYSQGAPMTGWTVSTTNSNTQDESSKTTYSQTFGYEDAFTGTGFLSGFGAKLSQSQTVTTSYEVENKTTVSNTFTGVANITGPACNGNPCNPAYPPSTQTYGEATEFDIFVDNFFGTFVFVPSAYN